MNTELSTQALLEFVECDNLYNWMKDHFNNFNEFKQWRIDNPKLLQELQEEREFYLVETCISGLTRSASKGNATAANALRSLTLGTNPVGRPKQTPNPVHEEAKNRRLLEEFDRDLARLNINK